MSNEFKTCCKCKINKEIINFGKLKSSKDNHRYDCKDCRKEYRIKNKEIIQNKYKLYYNENKEKILNVNKNYREKNSLIINKQRQEYRNRKEIKEKKKEKNKSYLPVRLKNIKERRKTDINFRLKDILKSKFYRMLKNKSTSFLQYLGCDLIFFKKWISYRFEPYMNWDNIGIVWQIDHIIPINSFNFSREQDIKICFHWTNLQPLNSKENLKKSDKLILHYYFNNIINIFRFTKINQIKGYQVVNESLQWLKIELRYGNNATYDKITNNYF